MGDKAPGSSRAGTYGLAGALRDDHNMVGVTIVAEKVRMAVTFGIEDARVIARRAHEGQNDLAGHPYIEHVEAVAAGLVDFDLDVQIAGMLHDVVEDSPITIDDLRREGVSERSLAAIGLVSKNLHPELSYSAGIALICQSADARFVKIADNAHNSLPERIADLTAKTGKPPNPRYAEARKLLYAATEQRDVERILRRTNTSLLEEAQTR